MYQHFNVIWREREKKNINALKIAYPHFRLVFPLSHKTLKHLLSHLLHWHWHPERLYNGHVELQSVRRYSKSSIQIPHQVDQHSLGMVSISIHLKMHQLRSQTIQHKRASLQIKQQQQQQIWLYLHINILIYFVTISIWKKISNGEFFPLFKIYENRSDRGNAILLFAFGMLTIWLEEKNYLIFYSFRKHQIKCWTS